MSLSRRLRRITLSQVAAALVVVFLLLPFVIVMGASFDQSGAYEIRFPPRSLSLEAYAGIGKYLPALGRSAMVGACVAALATVFGLMAALGIVRSGIVGKETLQAFFRLSVQIPMVVTGAVFLQFYYHVSAVLPWNPMSSMAGLVIAHLFVAIPYTVGAISAVLVRIDPSVEEAANSLGASHWATFREVTFPMLRPGLVAGMFYAFIMSFGDVPIAIFLVNQDTMTLPVQIFQDMQFDFQRGMLAVSTIVVVLSLALILGLQRYAGLDLVSSSGRK